MNIYRGIENVLTLGAAVIFPNGMGEGGVSTKLPVLKSNFIMYIPI